MLEAHKITGPLLGMLKLAASSTGIPGFATLQMAIKLAKLIQHFARRLKCLLHLGWCCLLHCWLCIDSSDYLHQRTLSVLVFAGWKRLTQVVQLFLKRHAFVAPLRGGEGGVSNLVTVHAGHIIGIRTERGEQRDQKAAGVLDWILA